MRTNEWYTPYLQPGEKVRWQGAPDKNEIFSPSELAAGLPMLFMLAWGGFILYRVLADGGVPWWALLAVFLVVGVWLMIAAWAGFGRALLSMYRLRKTEYVITDRRILRRMGRVVDGVDSRSIGHAHLHTGGKECGTITFGFAAISQDARYTRHPSLAIPASFELRAIPQAREVLRIIDTMEEAAPPVKPLSDLPLIPLEEGECVLWQGRPEQQGLRLTFSMNVNSDKLMDGIWGTLIGSLVVALLIWARDWQLCLFCTPFLAFWVYGLYCLGLFSLRIRRQLNDEEYVVTDRRVLRRTKKKVAAYTVSREDTIFLAQGRDGCGTVVIGNLQAAYRKSLHYAHNSSLANCKGFQLRCIPDPTRAMDALHTLIPPTQEEV